MIPTVSYIVTSYNYERFIAQAIDSLLMQEFDGLEVVVIDDCSSDGSWDIISSYDDRRVRAIRNDTNIGGNLSYKRAFEAARGRYVGNLDSDDWVEPSKTAKQVAALERNADLAIVGTWVTVVDAEGERHATAEAAETLWNVELNLNEISAWCVSNRLCRSSTMIRRSFHDNHGLYDLAMARAPDFEVWTRAMRLNQRIEVIPERLTNLRQHGGGVTHADPKRSLIEISYLLARNIVPLISLPTSRTVLDQILPWPSLHPSFSDLEDRQRWRLMAALVGHGSFDSFAAFADWLSFPGRLEPDDRIGALALTLVEPEQKFLTLEKDFEDLWRARTDWFIPQIERLEAELKATAMAYDDSWRLCRDELSPKIESLQAELAERDRMVAELRTELRRGSRDEAH